MARLPFIYLPKSLVRYQLRYRNVLLLTLKEPGNTFHFLALLSQPYIYIISQNLKNVKFSKVIKNFEP